MEWLSGGELMGRMVENGSWLGWPATAMMLLIFFSEPIGRALRPARDRRLRSPRRRH